MLGRDRVLSGAGTTWGSLGSIRIGESVGLQVFALLGLLYPDGDHLARDPLSAILLLLGLSLLFAHTFALNDWANIDEDLRDPRKAGLTFHSRRVARSTMRNLMLVLGLGAVLVFALLPPSTWPYALWFFAAGVLYSHPLFAMKRMPLASSAIHVVSGTAHFLVGYALFRPADPPALLVGLWCGLILAAGHFVQEVQDCDGDRAASVGTHAVRFGKRPVFLAAFVVFTASFALLVGLAVASLLPPRVGLLALLYPYLSYACWRTLRRGLEPEDVFALRRRYRFLFAVAVVVIGTALWSA